MLKIMLYETKGFYKDEYKLVSNNSGISSIFLLKPLYSLGKEDAATKR